MPEESAFDFIKKRTAVSLYEKLIIIKLKMFEKEKNDEKKNVLENEVLELIISLLEI